MLAGRSDVADGLSGAEAPRMLASSRWGGIPIDMSMKGPGATNPGGALAARELANPGTAAAGSIWE